MLKNKVLTGMMLLILVMIPTMVMAGDMQREKGMHGKSDLPMGKWWKNPEMAKKLNLADAEKAKLKEAFDKSHRKLIKLKSNVETERFELGSLLDKKALDEAAVMQQFTKLEKARTELARERFSFLIEVRKILGQERYQILKEEGKQRRKSRMHRRMERQGGPRPPHEEM
ncbi:MAG: periplasmic heavy metal sensor [Deltaproteobacteria bacterium]|nr:periplasmic heavy metal sensor [Deltaproteobacteria bacterium]